MAAPRQRQAPPPIDWRNRVQGALQFLRPADLDDHPLQWRAHPETQKAAMRGVLEQVGIAGVGLAYVSPKTGRLTSIDGHMRKSLGDVPWPTAILDVTDEEAEILLLSHDPLGALAAALAPQLQTLLHRPAVLSTNAALTAMFEGLAVQYKLVPPTAPAPGVLDTREETALEADDDFDTTPYGGPGSNIHMVQLFLTEDTYPPFKQAVDRLAEAWGLDTLTDTVVEAITRLATEFEDADAPTDRPT